MPMRYHEIMHIFFFKGRGSLFGVRVFAKRIRFCRVQCYENLRAKPQEFNKWWTRGLHSPEWIVKCAFRTTQTRKKTLHSAAWFFVAVVFVLARAVRFNCFPIQIICFYRGKCMSDCLCVCMRGPGHITNWRIIVRHFSTTNYVTKLFSDRLNAEWVPGITAHFRNVTGI